MADENSFASLLEDSFSENDESVEDYSSKLKDALENLNERFDAEHLQQALQECLSSCPDDLLDKKIFNDTLPLMHRLLSEALKRIVETIISGDVEDAAENVKRQLLLCHVLLDAEERSMDRASKLQKRSAVNLKSITENALLSIKLMFEHCRESKKLYGALFERVSEELAGLFRKAKTILNLFLATLEGVIVFDTDEKSETELLIKVIDSIGLFVTISRELDLKTFVETSKVFGKLAITHQDVVKRMQTTSVVTTHLAQMTKDVSSMLSLLQDSPDRIEERKIRVIGHSLKILDRLSAAYHTCINDDALTCVIELLLQMHRCSSLCWRWPRIDGKAIELINVHISRGSEPFLNTVFETSDFKQVFFEYGSRERIDNLGYHALTIDIMKILIGMPYEQHCEWTLGAESIIDTALTSINSVQEEIFVGQVRLPGAHEIGERPRHASLYEATLVPICGLISQIPEDGFHVVELILLKHLLSDRLWSSLLASDVWCFVGRIGSSELCASHVKYLLKVHAALTKRGNSLEVVVLENLIGRLYGLLSEETRHSVVTELDDPENPSWITLARFLPSKTRSFLQNRLACTVNGIPSSFAELQRQPTVRNWDRLMTTMSVVGKLNHASEKNTVDILSQIWTSIASTIEIFEGRQLDILSEFLSKLFDATQPEAIQDDVFFTILEAISTSFSCFPSHVRVIASHYLRRNVNAFASCGVRTANALAELNCHLLEDENPWVRQEALESFDHLAHICPNEDLVTTMAAAVTRRPSLIDSLPAYLSSTVYHELQDFPDVRLYLQHVAKNVTNGCHHVCYSYEDSQRDEKQARLEAPFVECSNDGRSFSSVLDERVNNVCDQLNEISKMNGDIGDQALRRLRSICEKILRLTESSE